MRLWPKCPNAYVFSRNKTFVELKSVKVEMNQDSNKSADLPIKQNCPVSKTTSKGNKDRGFILSVVC